MKTLSELSLAFFDLVDMHGYRSEETAESDKLCFRNTLKQFLSTGKKEDAFSVYFCFSEVFRVFGEGYENTKKLLEMLSDHEYHSGELLSKHRDHYSHSVYVFALGLAFYAHDPAFRKNYNGFYGLGEDGAFNFLKFWGMTSLFHDIGYPFQLAHEQIKTYAEEVWLADARDDAERKQRAAAAPYVSYGNLDAFIALEEKTAARLNERFRGNFSTYHDLLAYGLQVREGYDPALVCPKLMERVVRQPNFMDHGYFGAMILMQRLFSSPNTDFGMQHLDVLTAILLHNSFNKFDAPGRHPIGFQEHPLAYLLILCDELQCWDRHAYGKVSKRDPIAWEVGLEIAENSLTVLYTYDAYTVRTYDAALELDVILNKNYREMRDGVFLEKLLKYIVTPLRITVKTREKKKEKRSNLFASDDNFIGLCDLAKAIHASYIEHCKSLGAESISRSFGDLGLEFKLSNIEQAKSYAYKLELINCFYSRKDLDYPVVEDFNGVRADYKNNLGFLCREEHVRWVKEKLAMGWRYGTDYTTREERDAKKVHKDIVPYDLLPLAEQSKDELMVNNIIDLLHKFDSNIKIYNFRSGRKPNLEIAGTGHRFFNGDPEKLKASVKEILTELSKTHRVTVRTCFAYGADQLIAECAAELGLNLKADIPMPVEAYIEDVRRDVEANGHVFSEEDELRMRHLLAQTVVCRVVTDKKYVYAAASAYIVKKCDKLIALWDGNELPLEDENGAPLNRGGTYDCIRMARENKKEVLIVDCYR